MERRKQQEGVVARSYIYIYTVGICQYAEGYALEFSTSILVLDDVLSACYS